MISNGRRLKVHELSELIGISKSDISHIDGKIGVEKAVCKMKMPQTRVWRVLPQQIEV